MSPYPAERTYDMGETVYAHRQYIGVSQRDMAELIDMDRRTYQRIEKGDDPCPVGLVDSIAAITEKFDDDVERVVSAAEQSGTVSLKVSDDFKRGWERAVVARATVLAPMGVIRPILVAEYRDRRSTDDSAGVPEPS